MKKHIFFVVAAMACMLSSTTSCSNDDILIESTGNIGNRVADISITVRPESVVSGFTGYVSNRDELNTLSTIMEESTRLKVSMFLYKDGRLVDESSELTEKYSTITTSHHQLNIGKYTVVAVTYPVTPQDNGYTDYVWSVNDKENLSTIKLYSESGTGLRSVYGILGITVKEIDVQQNGDFVVDVQPAGAVVYMILTNCKNINTAALDHAPDAFGLLFDRKVNSIDIRNNELLASYESAEGNRRYWLARTSKSQLDSGRGATSITPCFIPTGDGTSRITLIPGYRYVTDNNQYYAPFGAQEYPLELKAGDEYLVELNLNSGATQCREFKNQQYR